MTKHAPATPLPWMYGELTEGVITPKGAPVASIPDDGIFEADIDMRYLAHAANAYPKLVAGLRSTLELIYSAGDMADSRTYKLAAALLRSLGEE